MATTTMTPTSQEAAMSAPFTVTVLAGSLEEAAAKVARHLPKVPGFEMTGRGAVADERHRLVDVEVAGDGDRDDLWVVLTSYGMSPSEALGSVWQTVPGVGCHA